MAEVSTFRDLFRHDDWARDRLFDAAASLSDGQLDREFPLGMGSLRKTMIHIHEAMYWWTGICVGNEDLPEPPQDEPLPSLRTRWLDTARDRDAVLTESQKRGALGTTKYTDRRASARTCAVGDILLHVYNHGVYHRAQAVNMLRHLGVKPPKLDYIFMHFENASPTPPALSMQVVRRYYQYTDWIRPRVLDVAAKLDDASLDRNFEMGMGTIRLTLSHTLDAERWWLGNWT
ncbi:MAG: DinB family protein, partial [Tepidisphaeraceae bacterium]